MAKVLVVDDNAANRALVVKLLEYQGHEALEAADGVAALERTRDVRPQLVISDILMPKMDGFEYVRELRDDPDLAQTEVIFYTAHYREREARELAQACGVSRVLIKPCDPEEILLAIAAGLARAPATPPAITPAFDREHMRLMADKLSQKADELLATNMRLAALTDLNLQLASELDPHKLLVNVCNGALDLVAARYALLGIREPSNNETAFFATSGLDDAVAARLSRPKIDAGVLGRVVADTAPKRIVDAYGDPRSIGLPADYPAVHSALIVPVASLTSTYGWICLVDKRGVAPFSDEDERLMSILAAQVGRIYENSSLYGDLRRNAEQLEAEIAERKRAQARIERLNRVYAVLSGINSLIVRVRSREELFSEACRLAVEHGRFRVAWIGLVDESRNELVPVAWAGENAAFAQTMRFALDRIADEESSVAARSIRSQTWVAVNDLRTEPHVLYRDEMLAHGVRSTAGLPLVVGERSVGYLALYAEEAGFFDDDEMRLLTELAGDIAFALDHIAKTERLDYLAYYDALTGLANRTLFHERLSQLVALSRHDERFAVVVIDVERFNTYADSMGRHVGDQLLQQVAKRLEASVGSAGDVGYVGAGHFAALVRDVQAEADVLRDVDRWWRETFGSPFTIGQTELSVSARAGMSVFPNDADDADTLIRDAEAAAMRAKSTGARHLFYAQEMSERAAEKLTLESKLRKALENNELVLHYQPKVDACTRRIVGVEALIRWQSPELGLVLPARFIPLMEETGIIVDAGEWALRRARLDRDRWIEMRLKAPRIAVNVSAIQLSQHDFVDRLERAVNHAGTRPGIDIEVTETLLMGDVDANIGKLAEVRDLGVHIAIDDFGTGYSSLGYLAKLPVETLKIDRSFISAMSDDPDAMTMVSTMISLAHSLRLAVVAEGVESEEQAKLLRLLRCDQIQGFLIARPMTFDGITAMLSGDGG